MGWSEWVRRVEIEPSIYAADFSRLGEQIEVLMQAGARIFQFDVGDGHFVEPITIGPIVLKSISPIVHRLGGVLDCHLMVENPAKHFRQIAEAGGDSVTVHFEACDDLPGVIRQARELELGVGVAFNPETEPDDVVEAAGELVDLVLCMSIHPGYSGQPFMPDSIPRIRRLRELLPEGVHVQVDGGVGPDNAPEIRAAGANLFVAGSSVFGQADIAGAYRRLVQAIS
ncbi:MAG: ribulose-phosphate 3-epimerase [Actinomycetota bacterium]|nr:ribulose-phosphate 3-epimerase [Actinomycetota bacterium]